MISLSNRSDDLLRDAKIGKWWEQNPQRALANNSVAFTEKPNVGQFMNEWVSLYESKSGERGIFNRVASKAQAAKNGRRRTDFEFGTNPCSEIILRPYQFCNLTEVVVRAGDTEQTLGRKVRLAAILKKNAFWVFRLQVKWTIKRWWRATYRCLTSRRLLLLLMRRWLTYLGLIILLPLLALSLLGLYLSWWIVLRVFMIVIRLTT
jgi:hypothetical protein